MILYDTVHQLKGCHMISHLNQIFKANYFRAKFPAVHIWSGYTLFRIILGKKLYQW